MHASGIVAWAIRVLGVRGPESTSTRAGTAAVWFISIILDAWARNIPVLSADATSVRILLPVVGGCWFCVEEILNGVELARGGVPSASWWRLGSQVAPSSDKGIGSASSRVAAIASSVFLLRSLALSHRSEVPRIFLVLWWHGLYLIRWLLWISIIRSRWLLFLVLFVVGRLFLFRVWLFLLVWPSVFHRSVSLDGVFHVGLPSVLHGWSVRLWLDSVRLVALLATLSKLSRLFKLVVLEFSRQDVILASSSHLDMNRWRVSIDVRFLRHDDCWAFSTSEHIWLIILWTPLLVFVGWILILQSVAPLLE